MCESGSSEYHPTVVREGFRGNCSPKDIPPRIAADISELLKMQKCKNTRVKSKTF